MLLSSIVLKESSNSLLKPTSNYDKLRKKKPKPILTYWDLRDLGYITD